MTPVFAKSSAFFSVSISRSCAAFVAEKVRASRRSFVTEFLSFV